jgi:hypothetical protein
VLHALHQLVLPVGTDILHVFGRLVEVRQSFLDLLECRPVGVVLAPVVDKFFGFVYALGDLERHHYIQQHPCGTPRFHVTHGMRRECFIRVNKTDLSRRLFSELFDSYLERDVSRSCCVPSALVSLFSGAGGSPPLYRNKSIRLKDAQI